jgi:hypothetical protein
MRTGGRLDLGIHADEALIYLIGGYFRLDGLNVATNQSLITGGGMEWTLQDSEPLRLQSGVSFTYLHYDQNLRYFTFGHGGYFSPQHFVNAAIPFKLQGASGDLRWQAQCAPGLNWFREDPVDYYPRRPDLMDSRAQNRNAMAQPFESQHPGRTNVALALDIAGHGGYRLTDQLEGGVRAGYRSGDYFQEIVGGVYLQLSFRPQQLPRPDM